MTEHHLGELAYLDTFSGLIPCRVTAAGIENNGRADRVRVYLTADRGAYSRGETIEANWYRVVPRSHVSRRSGVYRVNTNFRWHDCNEEENR